jgi:hypothetical protein
LGFAGCIALAISLPPTTIVPGIALFGAGIAWYVVARRWRRRVL